MIQIVVPTIYLIIAIIGLLGNGIVLSIMSFVVKVKSVTDVYITNLAVSDILLISSLPFWAADQIMKNWVFGDMLCKVLSGFTYINMYASIFFLTAMGIDRWLAVVQAVESRKRRTVKRAWISSIVIWITSLLFTILPVTFRSSMEVGNRHYCKWNFPKGAVGYRINLLHYAMRTVVGFVVPLCVIIFCYVGILRFMRKRNKSKSRRLKAGLKKDINKNQKVDKVTRMVSVIIACFVISWLPNQITNTTHLLNMSGLIDYGCARPSSSNFNHSTKSLNDQSLTSNLTVTETTTFFPLSTTNVYDDIDYAGHDLNINVNEGEFEDKLFESFVEFEASGIYHDEEDNVFGNTSFVKPTKMPYYTNNTTIGYNLNSSVRSTTSKSRPRKTCFTLKLMVYIHLITACLGFSNSTMNPFVYAFVGSTLKKHLQIIRNNYIRQMTIRRKAISPATKTSFVGSIIRRRRRSQTNVRPGSTNRNSKPSTNSHEKSVRNSMDSPNCVEMNGNHLTKLKEKDMLLQSLKNHEKSSPKLVHKVLVEERTSLHINKESEKAQEPIQTPENGEEANTPTPPNSECQKEPLLNDSSCYGGIWMG